MKEFEEAKSALLVFWFWCLYLSSKKTQIKANQYQVYSKMLTGSYILALKLDKKFTVS